MKDGVHRGLSYYVEDGFEAEVASLGAQKQVAGGGLVEAAQPDLVDRARGASRSSM